MSGNNPGIVYTKKGLPSVGLWFSFVMVTAYLNAVLKTSPEGDMTLFRLLLPMVILYMAQKIPTTILKFSLFAVFVVLYSYIISYLPFNRFQNFNLSFTLHYVLVPFCFVLIKFFIDLLGIKYFYVFFKRFHYVMLILALVQFFFGGIYPNIQDRGDMVSIFFWNENEFTAVLAIFLPIYFLTEKASILKYSVIALSLFFIVYSDARLLLIGLFIFFAGYYMVRLPLYRYRFLWLLLLAIMLGAGYYFFADKAIFDTLTIDDIFIDSVRRIITLDDFEGIGSVISRINAYIWGQLALYDTYLFGIGPANSFTIMLENTPRGLENFAPKSFHNMILQMVVEIGFIGIALLYVLYRLIKKTLALTPYRKAVVICFYIAALIFTTILSSAFSNYPFIFIFVFSLYFFRADNSQLSGR